MFKQTDMLVVSGIYKLKTTKLKMLFRRKYHQFVIKDVKGITIIENIINYYKI